MHLNISPSKWWPFCFGLSMLWHSQEVIQGHQSLFGFIDQLSNVAYLFVLSSLGFNQPIISYCLVVTTNMKYLFDIYKKTFKKLKRLWSTLELQNIWMTDLAGLTWKVRAVKKFSIITFKSYMFAITFWLMCSMTKKYLLKLQQW